MINKLGGQKTKIINIKNAEMSKNRSKNEYEYKENDIQSDLTRTKLFFIDHNNIPTDMFADITCLGNYNNDLDKMITLKTDINDN